MFTVGEIMIRRLLIMLYIFSVTSDETSDAILTGQEIEPEEKTDHVNEEESKEVDTEIASKALAAEPLSNQQESQGMFIPAH